MRVQGAGALNAEPEVANPASDPCASSATTTANVNLPSLLSAVAGPASTASASARGSAAAQVANVNVQALGITADAANANASYACANGSPVPAVNSDVVNLSIGGGTPITTSGPVSLPVGGVADVELNRTISSTSQITRRAVDITVLGGSYNGAEIVLGEATAGLSGNPCDIGTSGLQPPGTQSGPASSTPSTSATFTFSSQPGTTLQCSLDNRPATPCNSTATFTDLPVGEHTLTVRELQNGVLGPASTFRWNVTGGHVPVSVRRPVISGKPGAGRVVSCSTGKWTNGPTRYSYRWSREGTVIFAASGRRYRVKTGDEGLRLTCTVTAYNAAGAGRPATSRRIGIPVPHVAGCPRATGAISGRTLGLVRVGMTRLQARRAYPLSSTWATRNQDFFCLTPIGVRVAYASNALMRTLSSTERQRVRGRVVMALTANAYYALHGVRPGATLNAARRALGTGNLVHLGLNFWYFVPHRTWTAVLKVRHGIVQEVGVADGRLTTNHRAQLKLMGGGMS